MSDKNDSIETADRDVADSIADDSIKLFRAGLLMITIYAALLSVVLRSGDTTLSVEVRDSPYTRFGFVFWMGSMAVSVITYWASRRLSSAPDAGLFVFFRNTQDLSDFTTSTLLSFLTSVFLLVFGLIDAYIKSEGSIPSEGGLELITVGKLLGLSTLLVFVIGGIIFFVRLIRSSLSTST